MGMDTKNESSYCVFPLAEHDQTSQTSEAPQLRITFIRRLIGRLIGTPIITKSSNRPSRLPKIQ